MSDLRIKDGTGGGSCAKVDGDNRLWTAAVTKDTLGYIADTTGYSFTWSAMRLTLTGTDEHLVLRVKNTDSQRHLHLHRFLVGWNGGSTNFNRQLEAAMYVGTYPPSANYTTLAASSTNFGKTLVAPVEAQVWDGVGTGMTVATKGVRALHSFWKPGNTDIILGGSLIVPFGSIIGFSVQGSEIGVFSLLVSGWFEEAHDT